jgi:hypothetical protein
VVVAGDVSDPAAIKGAVDTAIDRFGALHGVLHAAGLPGIGLMQFKTKAEMAKVMAPKVAGTIALRKALRDVPIDFLVLFSSITSATGGGPGQVDYCAANAYLDATANAAVDCPRTVAIGWGEWQWNAWSAGLAGYDPELREFFQNNRKRFGIDFDAGWRALRRVLAGDENYLVVNTQDFAAQARMSKLFNLETIGGARDHHLATARHPRPDLASAFVPPEGPTECAIAEVWSDLLGLDQVGAVDSFFGLGGNSLIGMEVMARIRRRLNIDELAPHVLYEAPTVRALAEMLGRSTETPAAQEEPGDRAQARRASLRRRNKGNG